MLPNWMIGFAVALGAGYIVTEALYRFLHWVSEIEVIDRRGRLPPYVTGLFERTLAFVVVATSFPDFQNILLAWLAAKAAANWNREEPPESKLQERYVYRSRSIMALMLGIVSVAMGIVGGKIGNGEIPLPI